MLCYTFLLHLILLIVQAIYTPSKIDGGQVLEYENGLAAANAQMLKNFNTSLLALKPASEAGKSLPWGPHLAYGSVWIDLDSSNEVELDEACWECE